MTIQPRRRPKHPPFTVVPLAGILVALVTAVMGLTSADGATTETIWIWATAITVIAALPTAAAGIADLGAMRPGTRAARTSLIHSAIMTSAVVVLALLVFRALKQGGDDIDAFEGVATILAGLVLLGGAAVGAAAMHVFGAGVREETLSDEARGGRRVAVTGSGR